MSLDTVAEDITDEARERAERIRAEADERATEIVDEAESDADEIVAEREREIERRIEQERDQRLSSAKLEAKQERLEARREILEAVRTDTEAQIAGLSGERRESLTRELLEDAATEFEGQDSVQVYGRADDAALLESLVADRDGFAHAGERECLGGVIVESEGSRVRVTNTFDSVLDATWDDHLDEISARLFER